jgi:hypothetical protein
MSLDGLDSPRLDEKDCWLRHWGSGSPRDSVGRFGSSVCFGSVGLESAEPAKSAKSAESAAGADYESGRFMVQGLTKKTVGPDKGAAAAMPTGGKSAAQICAVAGSSGRIGSAHFSTNMGWTMDCPGHAGKFIEGTR